MTSVKAHLLKCFVFVLVDWYRDSQGTVILDGDFFTNFPIAPPTITLKLPASQWQADFLADTLPPQSHLGLLPFELTLDFGANGGVSVVSANGVIWAPQQATAAAPEPGTLALAAAGLAGLGLVAYRRRKSR